MLLSELEGHVEGETKKIFDVLWSIVSGKIPKLDFFTTYEVRRLLDGYDVDGVRSPFRLLGKNMVVRTLPLMILQTTEDKHMRRRQMSLCRFFDTVNKMLEVLELEAESIELGSLVF